MNIRIILVDDHKLMREGLASLLEKHAGLSVIAQTENGRTAIQLTQKLSPDIVVMDVSMPDLNGIDATRQIISRSPGTKVVALSMHSDKQFVVEMFRAGASGYILKDAALEDLANAIRTVVREQTYVLPKIAGLDVEDFMLQTSSPELLITPRLTEREREVLQLMSEGKGTKEIAAELHLSAKTVETHRQHLMDKLEIYTVAELTKYAIREGITTLDH
ncbi:MAG: response regulator transcription factor [Verrucomicrobiota bacterium]|nr:response regulator transcription factor [Verrucomicrobiota bacterium]